MGTTEHTINDAIAEVLRHTRHGWSQHGVVRSENTGTLSGGTQRPDILICELGVSPVVVETEVLPAVTVEPEAKDRLGRVLQSNGRKILSAVAVRSPLRLRAKAGAALAEDVATAQDFEFALFTGESAAAATR